MIKYTVDKKTYEYRSDVRNNDELRNSFFSLSKSVFKLDFEPWYSGGYWTERYIPHVLADGGHVAANVSVNIIDIELGAEVKRFIQLGTVMTEPLYRGQGLSRLLMEKVIEEWRGKCELIYLYANDSVADFYPKFGFVKSAEYQCSKVIDKSDLAVKKLNMAIKEDKDLLLEIYKLSNPYSCFAMKDNPGLLMFYCTKFLRDNIYYLPKTDTVIIAEVNEEKVTCYDVFTRPVLTLEEAIGAVIMDFSAEVILGFTPKEAGSWNVRELKEDDTTFFVLAGKENIFEQKKLMFPLLSRA